MNVEDTINGFTNENGFSWGINTVMDSLRPGAIYSLSCSGGMFEIIHWDENNELPKPTPQEIRDEYIRQQTIAECLNYFKPIKEKRGLIWDTMRKLQMVLFNK